MLPFLSNVFNDPSDPWYYVVGVIFLLLIFGAVGLYMYLTSKKNKKNAEADNAEVKTDEQAPENVDTVAEPQEQDKE